MSRVKTDERIGLADVMVLNEMQAKSRYNLGSQNLVSTAKKAKALVPLGKRKYGYLKTALDEYFKMAVIE